MYVEEKRKSERKKAGWQVETANLTRGADDHSALFFENGKPADPPAGGSREAACQHSSPKNSDYESLKSWAALRFAVW